MSFIPCVTLANLTTPVTSIGGVPPYNGSNVPNLVVSTVIANSFIDTNVLNASTINSVVNNSSTLNTSTINVTYLDLDGQVLTANATALLLNGIPIATASNISSLADWSLYPVLPSGFNGGNAAMSNIQSIQSFSGMFQSLMTNVLTVNTLVAQSTIQNFSTITTVDVITDIVNTSTIVAGTGTIELLNTSTITAESANVSSLTISTITGGSANLDFVTLSTITAESGTISSFNTSTLTTEVANIQFISTGTINGENISANGALAGQGVFASTLTFANSIGASPSGQLTINAGGSLTFNGSTIAAGAGDVSTWSQYPATQLVNMNTQALSNAGAITATTLVCSSNITSAGIVNGNSVTGSSMSASGNASSGSITTGSVTSSGLVNCQNGFNGTGSFSFIGNLGESVVLSTDANATGIRLQLGAMLLTCPAAFSLNAGGAGNLSAGGAISIAAGDYIDMNAGTVNIIGGSVLNVTTTNTSNLTATVSVNTPLLNTFTIQNPVGGGNVAVSSPLSVPTLVNVTTINGTPVGNLVNVSTFNTASISSLTVSSITANYISVAGLETATIENVSTLNASTITTNTLRVSNIETSAIENVSSITASSITSYFGSISTLNISTLNTIPAYKILPNQPTYQIYVAKNGSDTLGTGSIMQPFLTIAKALTTATAYSDTNIVTILLTPGNYTEAVSVTRNNTFINGLSVNSQEVSITGAVSFTTTTQTIGYIVGGVVGLTITGSLTFSSTAAVPILYTALSGVINGISGTIPLTVSQTSTTNSFSFTTQGMVISPVDTIGVSVNNTRCSFVQTLITGTTTLVQTTGNGAFTIFGSTLTNTNSTATAPPIVKLANTVAVASGAMAVNNSYLSYTSATVDTGLNKTCVQLSTTTTATMNMSYNFLYCEGARVTNGSAGQYLCVQNPGTGVITFNYGGNYSGATANHFPNASAKFVKTGYIATT